jgi:hypothetical protein
MGWAGGLPFESGISRVRSRRHPIFKWEAALLRKSGAVAVVPWAWSGT